MRTVKRILTVCAALLLALTAMLPASAAVGSDSLTMAGAMSGEDVVAAAPAVVCNFEGVCTVITNSAVHTDGAEIYLVILGGRDVEMVYQDELSDGLSMFKVDASYLSQPQVLDIAQSIQVDEELVCYYFYPDAEGNVSVKECPSRIIEEDGEQLFSVSVSQEVFEQMLRPYIGINQAGELAIVNGPEGYYNLAAIEEKGAAPTPAPAEPTPAPPEPTPAPPEPTPAPAEPTPKPLDPGPENTWKGRDPAQDPDPAPASNSGSDSDSDFPTTIVICAAAFIAALAVSAVVVTIVRKGKAKNAASAIPAQPTDPIQPTAPAQTAVPIEPIPDIPEQIEPVEIKPQPRPRTSALYLCCEGGALDGRRYPVGPTPLLIGRDPGCGIRYPAETKGVSRRHCEIFWKNGVLHIMDLGSTSGTFIRGKGQIMANVPVAVNAGDTFYLGEKRNAFVIRMGE